jgi:two-component system response regulator (stage 0 sporulation protein F)
VRHDDSEQSIQPRLRVFLAEDDGPMREMIASALRRDGHLVLESANGAALLLDLGHAFFHDGPDAPASVIISDLRMPARDGLAILRGLRHERSCPPFILITAFGDPEVHAQARRLGVYAVFDKPFDLAALRATLEQIADSAFTDAGTAA